MVKPPMVVGKVAMSCTSCNKQAEGAAVEGSELWGYFSVEVDPEVLISRRCVFLPVGADV